MELTAFSFITKISWRQTRRGYSALKQALIEADFGALWEAQNLDK